MPPAAPKPIATFRVDALRVSVFRDRGEAGAAAADFVRFAVERFFLTAGQTRIVFAAAPSQNEFLADLATRVALDWSRITAFHMDEYLGFACEHPCSFRHYLNQHLFKPAQVPHERLRLIPGERVEEPLSVCLEYERWLKTEPPDIVCAGVGENGHLAFNDPPVADFLDPIWVKVVRLEAACRVQQVRDGSFARLEDVPTHAYTLTIPALLAAPVVSVTVPGPRKAEAVRAALRGPIDESCPASALRKHEGAALWLDRESAALVL